jgi:VWFA-related protein
MIGLLAGVLTLLQQPAVPARSAATLLVDAVAVDGRGTPVADLKPAEFELWINRYRIPIESVRFVSPETSPAKATMVLLLDDMAATPELAARVREAARQFVSRLADGETIAIVPLNGEPIQPTGDRPRLISAIDSYHVLKTIASISRQLMEVSEGRKTIVGIGVSWLFDRPLPPPNRSRDLRPEWIDAMRATAAAHASVYVVDPAPVGRAPYPDAGQSGFARETGGRAFVGTNDTGDVAERIWREARTYYLIEVADPPIGRKDPLRELEVRVLRRGVTVRARSAIEP